MKKELLNQKDWLEMKTVHAHRVYMCSLSNYKLLRYGTANMNSLNKENEASYDIQKSDPTIQWYDVDQQFIETIKLYDQKALKYTGTSYNREASDDQTGVRNQPIFIDLIIRVMLKRAFANIMDKKVLTAEKILGNAEALIGQLELQRDLKIVGNEHLRQGSKPFSIALLKSKYHLMKGTLEATLNRYTDAQDAFLNCIEYSQGIYHRPRKESISRLITIMEKQQRMDQISIL